MPRSRSELNFFERLEPESLQDIAFAQGQKWIEVMRKELSENKYKSANGSTHNRFSTGKLAESLVPVTSVSPTYAQVEIKGVKYAKNVDKGRKPNSTPPPINSMLEFIRHRSLKPKGKQTYEQLAFSISKNIGKKGIPATNFVKNSITKESIIQFKKDLAKGFKQGLV